MNKNEKELQRLKELEIIQDAVLGGSAADQFTSTHNLDFEVGQWPFSDYKRFRIGTMEGLWGSEPDALVLLALMNSEPGNGHFQDVFDWFEYSCRRDALDLIVDELWNKRLEKHLINKRGFTPMEGRNAVIKDVRDM